MKPLNYTRRPEPVQAMRFDGTREAQVAIRTWVGKRATATYVNEAWGLKLLTPIAGEVQLDVGDYVVRDATGSYHRMPGHAFSWQFVLDAQQPDYLDDSLHPEPITREASYPQPV